MKKRITLFICMVIFCAEMLCPICVSAATAVDPGAKASLTLLYQKEGQTFSGLPVSIYRVAGIEPDGTAELTEPYASYPISIHGITKQEQWNDVAAALDSYIVADGLAPYREGKTDGDGVIAFDDIETGLYLVSEVTGKNNSGTYVFNRFMVYLPTPQSDGSCNYDVEAKPKCTEYVPNTEYKVTKLWQDSGNTADRPKEITVDIYRNGEKIETQILSAENNWTYVWYDSGEEQGKWTVVERSVANMYTVSIRQNGATFSIINTHGSDPELPDSPQTGDTSDLYPYIITVCISGIVLVLFGVYGRRRRAV